jgi:hypothetical protein
MSEKTMTIYNNSLRRFKVTDTKKTGAHFFLEPGQSAEVLEKEAKILLSYEGIMDAAKLVGKPVSTEQENKTHDELQKKIIELNNTISALEAKIKELLEGEKKSKKSKNKERK